MELFKFLLFGISGLSMIFWVAVIGIWHVDMFPRFFKEDRLRDLPVSVTQIPIQNQEGQLLQPGALRPSGASNGLFDRAKYSRKSFVIRILQG